MMPVQFCDGFVKMNPLGENSFCDAPNCNKLALKKCDKKKTALCCCCTIFEGCGKLMCKNHMYFVETKD